jgi:glycosidase
MKKKKESSAYFHYLQPDYDRPVFRIPDIYKKRIKKRLHFLYGEGNEEVKFCFQEIERIMRVYYAHKTPLMLEWEAGFVPSERFTERDIVLITYGDIIRAPYEKPLRTLYKLLNIYLKDLFNIIHILPFYPYSSDKGFAVMDFLEVDPNLGSWDDILDLKDEFNLMFDGVFNHVSSKSRWFQEFLNQNPFFKDFFTVLSTKQKITADHLKLIVRPRTTDILTEFSTLNGRQMVWTTFSPDQIDLNYKNLRVLVKMIDILLNYVRRGADIIRLDAVTYLWEEIGTSCVHLEQSHVIIKLFRDILNAVAPHVALVTETNVAHRDNIRYLGNGYDEAQMVYNFALPPLVLHAFHTENTTKLTQWAETLEDLSEQTTYFNFLDSHDGIGLMAVTEILSKEEIENMSLRVVEHGGFISYKNNGDGTVSPYELNITWYSALNREDSNEPVEIQIQRYLASRSIALAFIGVPGIYIHGLFGSKNDVDAVLEEKQTRSINRKSIKKDDLIKALTDQNSNIYKVSSGMIDFIRLRINEKAFHPNAKQRILFISESVFAIVRISTNEREQILAITNVTRKKQKIEININQHNLFSKTWYDLLTRRTIKTSNNLLHLAMNPYDVYWLKASL